MIDIMDVDIRNDALLVDDEEGSLGYAVRPEHAVFGSHRTMGIKIGEDGKPQLLTRVTHLLGPRVECGNIVHGNAEQDRVVLIEEAFRDVVAGPLIGAYRRPRCGDKVSS